MLAPDTLTRPVAAELTQSPPAQAGSASVRLAEALAALGVENHSDWAWDNYKRVVHDLCVALKAHRILEVGGGRDPLFTPAEIAELGVEMTVNDISPKELAVLPPGYNTACFDIAGDLSDVGHLRNTQDLAFSRMVFEHVADGQRAWANLYQVLAPGGVAMAFIPTFYSVPFVLNWLLPDKLAAAIVKRMFAHRTDEDDPVFPAHYSWCLRQRAHHAADAVGDRLSRDRDPAVLRAQLLCALPGHSRRAQVVHRRLRARPTCKCSRATPTSSPANSLRLAQSNLKLDE